MARISKVGKVKWTFKLPMYASGRRLANDGIVITGLRYAINYIYVLVRGKPITVAYTDIREGVEIFPNLLLIRDRYLRGLHTVASAMFLWW